MSRVRLASLTLLSLAGVACGNAGEGLGIGLPANGALSTQIFYDRDFSGTPSPADTAFAGLQVFALVAGTQDTVGTATTNANGVANFTNLPPGQYTIAVDSAQVLGDTMITTLIPARVSITSRGTAPFISVRVGYPVLTVPEARAGAVGRKVVVSATVLAGVQSFSDTTAHVRGVGAALRLTQATVVVGGQVVPGDLVRVLGRIRTRNGQPVLDSVQIVLVNIGPKPAPDTLTSAEAAQALLGARDADLVRVTAGEITDTLTQGADLRVTIDDGTGPLEVLIDPALSLPSGMFLVGDSLNVAGVLVPGGGGSWQLKPRTSQDIVIF